MKKTKYEIELFDLAVEMTIGSLAKSGNHGYIGRPRGDDIDDPEEIGWTFFGGDSDSRYGGSCYDFFECQKSDRFGNILPETVVVTLHSGEQRREERKFYLHNVEADAVVLFVKRGLDLQYDKYGEPKMRGRGKDRDYVYEWGAPDGKTGGLERRIAKREAERLAAEKKARWEARGTLYSPWMNHWRVEETHPEFYKLVRNWMSDSFTRRNEYGTAGLTVKEITAEAERVGVDTDELEQYLSEQSRSLSEAFRNSYMSNN